VTRLKEAVESSELTAAKAEEKADSFRTKLHGAIKKGKTMEAERNDLKKQLDAKDAEGGGEGERGRDAGDGERDVSGGGEAAMAAAVAAKQAADARITELEDALAASKRDAHETREELENTAAAAAAAAATAAAKAKADAATAASAAATAAAAAATAAATVDVTASSGLSLASPEATAAAAVRATTAEAETEALRKQLAASEAAKVEARLRWGDLPHHTFQRLPPPPWLGPIGDAGLFCPLLPSGRMTRRMLILVSYDPPTLVAPSSTGLLLPLVHSGR
jgi:hypothetical protein